MKNINNRTDISIESFNSRINQGEESISELEDRILKLWVRGAKQIKRKEKDDEKRLNSCIIVVAQGEERKKGKKKKIKK